jgi:hypothetical protein
MDASLQKELFDLAKTIIERLTSAPVVVLAFIVLFKKQIEAFFKSVSEPVGRVVESLLSRSFKLGLNKEGLKLEAEAATTAVIAQEKALPSGAEKGLVSIATSTGVIKAEGGPVAASFASTPSGDDAKRLEAVKNINVPPIALEQANIIRAELDKLGIIDTQERADLLVKHLAVTQLWLRAEIIYRTIFGSQIQLLKSLNTRPGSTTIELLEFYEQAKTNFPKLYETYSFGQYLQYVRNQGLISEDAPEHYIITVAGREFLKWMTDRGLADTKAF